MLSGRERQVVILAVGAVWRAPYELYAHSAAGRTAGLSSEQVDTRAADGMPDDLSAREQCARRFARQLTAERHIGNHSMTKRRNCSEPTGSATCST